MAKNAEKLMREVLAALIGSKLAIPDLRSLAEELRSDRRFVYELAEMLMELSFKLGSQSNFEFHESELVEPETQAYGGLTDLAYSVVQRKRLSKAKLLDIFSMYGLKSSNLGISRDMPTKEMVHLFLENAGPKGVQGFMSYLGLDIGQDAYLGVIGGSRR